MEYRDGMLVSCEIKGTKIEKATLARENSHYGKTHWFLLQDLKDGYGAVNKRGYKYSWNVSSDNEMPLISYHYDVTNLKEISNMRFKQGDVITDGCSYRRILGVCGESYISTTGSSNLNDVIGSKIIAAVFSDYELRDYSLYTPPVESPVIEISKDEAFRILAKERGVDVSKVRIKD